MEIGLWLPVWEMIERRYAEKGLGDLDEDERLWLVLRRAIDEVENDGLLGLFCAAKPPQPRELLAAWLAIGAEDMHNVFERATALLPQGLPPEDDDQCEALIKLWQDDDYAKLVAEIEDDFYELLPQSEELLDEVVKKILMRSATARE